MTRHNQWHISGWPVVLLFPVAFIAGIAIELATRILGLSRTADLTPKDVEGYIDDFLNDRGADFDWDDFCSIPLTDPRLDAIRDEADSVPLPLDDRGQAHLRDLLARVRALS